MAAQRQHPGLVGRGGPRANPRPRIATHRSRFAVAPSGTSTLPPLNPKPTFPPPPPANWVNSQPEWWVFAWLTMIRKWTDGQEFAYQVKVAGGRLPGGVIPDFVIYARQPPLVLNINGLYYHAEGSRQLQKTERDRQQLIENGFDVAFLWEDDLRDRLDYTMTQAVDFGRTISNRPLPF